MRDEFLRRDLAAGNARHDRVGAVLLHVREEVVVGVLQRRLVALQHELVPARGEHRRDGRFADVAAHTSAVLVDQCVEGLHLADAHQVIQLLARVREVFAQVVVYRDAADRELGFQHLRATSGAQPPHDVAAFVAFFNAPMRRAAGFDGGADRTFRDVVARTDLRRRGVRQHRRPPPFVPVRLSAPARRCTGAALRTSVRA